MIILKNGKISPKSQTDHSFLGGRPCIYIGAIGEVMYFLTLTNGYNDSKKYLIKPSNNNKLEKPSMASYNNIISKNFSFYETRGYINEIEMLKIFKDMLNYYKRYNCSKVENVQSAIFLANSFIQSRSFANCETKPSGGKK